MVTIKTSIHSCPGRRLCCISRNVAFQKLPKIDTSDTAFECR